MSLLVVGTLAFDSVETPFGKRDDVLGGSASYLSTSAAFFGPTLMAGVVGEDFPDAHWDFFKSRGIDLAGVQRLGGKTFRWRGHYDHDLNTAHTLETQLNVLEAFNPDLPAHYRKAQYVVLGNFDPELQERVLNQVDSPKLVALDTMNFWIERANAKLHQTLKRVHLLSINEAEARQLSGEYGLVQAARAILTMGPHTLVIKRGEYGSLMFTKEGMFAAPGLPVEEVCDPTGAGDTFAGGLMGHVARANRTDIRTLRQAVVVGNSMASFVVSDFSLDRLRTLTANEIRQRLVQMQSLVQFDSHGLDG